MSNLDVLNGASFMNPTTYKKDGTPMPTPVWFARVDDKAYVMTLANVGKVKRIRNNGQVTIAPCDARGTLKGDTVAAQAQLLPKEAFKAANDALNRKYGLMKRLFDLMQIGKERIYIEVR